MNIKTKPAAAFWCAAISILFASVRAEETPNITAQAPWNQEGAIKADTLSKKPTNKDLLYGRGDNPLNLYNDCRRFPLWIGNLRESCIQHTGWAPHRQWWWLDAALSTLGENLQDNMQECMEQEFLDFMDTWPNCDDKDNEYDLLCFVPPNIDVTSYYRHGHDGDLVTIEWALTPQEAQSVSILATCIRQIFPQVLPYFEKRAFGATVEEEALDIEPQLNNYLLSGNICTYLVGLLQIFAPGVAAQMMQVASVAWSYAHWYDDSFGHMPDPQHMGIRVAEHLHYESSARLGVHIDYESIYTIVVALSHPGDYEGGEFRLSHDNSKFKPNQWTALVFRSEIPHGVESVLNGLRETFVMELWTLPDSGVGLARPSEEFMERFSFMNSMEKSYWKGLLNVEGG